MSAVCLSLTVLLAVVSIVSPRGRWVWVGVGIAGVFAWWM